MEYVVAILGIVVAYYLWYRHLMNKKLRPFADAHGVDPNRMRAFYEIWSAQAKKAGAPFTPELFYEHSFRPMWSSMSEADKDRLRKR